MSYIDIINSVYNQFNLTPRGGQVDSINKILELFIDEQKEYVVLSAPTGTGKSIIAVIVAECLNLIDRSVNSERLSFINIHNKTLQEQYEKFFKTYSGFINIVGAVNYSCNLISGTAEECVIKSKFKTDLQALPKECKYCKYRLSRISLNNTPHVITNYSYFFISTLYSKILKPRLITIYDEAHILNEVFCSHMAIFLSEKIFDSLLKAVELSPIAESNNFKLNLIQYKSYLKQLTLSNYLERLNIIYGGFASMRDAYSIAAATAYESGRVSMYKALLQISNRFSNLYCKYDDLLNYKYDNVIDIVNNTISIKPIFMHDMFIKVSNSKYHLFMSATIDSEYTTDTLNLPQLKVGFVKVPPIFPPESKQIIFLNHTAYNYTSLQDKKTLNDICKLVEKIIRMNHSLDSGIILTPSFYINKLIYQYLKSKALPVKLYTQEQGTHLKDILYKFKQDPNPSILISPSLFEGIDLPDAHSSYQIMIKAPYQSLNDKRIKLIATNYPNIYHQSTLYKIIQGFGRSTRHIEDNSITYCLDTHIKKIFDSKSNHWKEEFEIKNL